MSLRYDRIARLSRWLASTFRRIAGWIRGGDWLATERAIYAEIGQIVAVPFNVANVYERFADEVAKIIPFELITITQVDLKQGTFTVLYTLGTEVAGLGQGMAMPLADSAVVTEVASSKQPLRIVPHQNGGPVDQAMIEAGFLSRIATPWSPTKSGRDPPPLFTRTRGIRRPRARTPRDCG
jgi:hypothetical protein